ncbi:MAG: zinc dependent phospholipase C family protein [Candidatus Marinimicrobia bacterium]|nr:zinc dependent phospholipase C family protein [Candidatus Neomarinimicrobiota bacterium]MBL7010162.1 zinc dependent phospholipase C family protein [Candidatus Neomarinimicrobiota bacterium]MBL7030427.1 zinc dependent phospholipase C family protein [Candidatus Neomarinimicrobiota bacterium]
MKRASIIWLLIVPLVLTSFVGAWRYDGHRRINYIASQQLNGPFGSFVKRNADALKWYGPAPDYIKRTYKNEFHRHFIDADGYDDFPFKNIPKNYNEFVSKYGEDTIKKMGEVPWAIEQTCDRIIYLFKNDQFEEAVYYMGALGHYMADIHMPLHTVLNYNGQFTGNDGIHFRWEGRLVDEYIKRIHPVGAIEKVADPWTFAMDIVRESYQEHQRLLDADTKARSLLTKDQAKELNTYKILSFEKPYLDVLYNETENLLKDRLGRSAIRIASIWQYCWEQAGRPELP